ncbi:F-box protein At2g02240 [Lactuca sativa]|uniref:F-box protein At2g02240 n=1 Tax=Lactuca sativa TaxID=4236 RepID=UPI000CB88BAB|nr:F-box protein At2g02240 [Lactuca sativa]
MQTCGMPKGFDSAAYSDAFWERLLRSDYRELIARAVSPLDFGSKNKLYFSLSYTHILLDRGYLSFQLDKESGKKCYMLGAKELSITWQHDTQYWEWTHIPESRFPEVCILKQVYWLSIHGRIVAGMLSQNNTYDAYLVFGTTKDSRGVSVPAKTRLSFGGSEMETENVYLQRPHRVQENYVFPHKRKDGWMEIKLGEFDYNEGDNGKVEMAYEEIKLGHWKKGLIVEGIELRPK